MVQRFLDCSWHQFVDLTTGCVQNCTLTTFMFVWVPQSLQLDVTSRSELCSLSGEEHHVPEPHESHDILHDSISFFLWQLLMKQTVCQKSSCFKNNLWRRLCRRAINCAGCHLLRTDHFQIFFLIMHKNTSYKFKSCTKSFSFQNVLVSHSANAHTSEEVINLSSTWGKAMQPRVFQGKRWRLQLGEICWLHHCKIHAALSTMLQWAESGMNGDVGERGSCQEGKTPSESAAPRIKRR